MRKLRIFLRVLAALMLLSVVFKFHMSAKELLFAVVINVVLSLAFCLLYDRYVIVMNRILTKIFKPKT